MTVADAYDTHDALGLARLVRAGELSPTELLEEALRRVEARNPTLNAVCAVFEERARAQIAAGLPDSPLAGVPFLLKDLGVDLAGEVTSNGSRFFASAVATRTSYVVQRYLDAGLVVFGKTNTPEMGLNVSTEPVLFGPTRNPWDHARSAGGSSGGAGAAVAGGIVPAAHATDGGGSIRIPASCNGLFGLKPTRGRTPMGPPLGESWNGLSHGHAVSRSVRDSAALLDIAAGPSIGEPYSAPPAPAGGFLAAALDQPGPMRIGVTTTPRPGIVVDEECNTAVTNATTLLRALGHELVEVQLPVDWDALMPAFGVITGAHIAAAVHERAEALGRAPGPDDLEAITRAQVSATTRRGALDYVAAVKVIHAVGRTLGAFFETVDAVLTPTLGTVPPPIGEMFADVEDLAAWGRRAGRISCFLGVMNATGQPAMSLPLHWSAGGLPVGVQIMGRFGDDGRLLALARQVEAAAPWAHRRPPAAG
jgi:Asp-tRNA(Asn)/Glu-tRNA(Gln) amidotransferase A subunit family amidase